MILEELSIYISSSQRSILKWDLDLYIQQIISNNIFSKKRQLLFAFCYTKIISCFMLCDKMYMYRYSVWVKDVTVKEQNGGHT
jgi:hypothetical protein